MQKSVWFDISRTTLYEAINNRLEVYAFYRVLDGDILDKGKQGDMVRLQSVDNAFSCDNDHTTLYFKNCENYVSFVHTHLSLTV